MKCCVLTVVGTWTNWLNFEPDPDYSPDTGTWLLSPISYKRFYAEFYVWKIPRTVFIQAAARRGFKMVLFTEPSEHLCRRYMRSIECPSMQKRGIQWQLYQFVCSLTLRTTAERVNASSNRVVTYWLCKYVTTNLIAETCYRSMSKTYTLAKLSLTHASRIPAVATVRYVVQH